MALPSDQSLSFNYKQYLFVASTGLVPYEDSTYGVNYHWSANQQWGLDLGIKMLDANYTISNDLAGAAPSLRDDLDYGASVALNYAVTPHLSFSLLLNYDTGSNALANLAATYAPDYREFQHRVITFGAQYKF